MVESTTPVPLFNEPQLRVLSLLLDRMQLARLAGQQYDGRRDLYTVLGYDRTINAQQYRDEYARGGIAKTIIDTFPNATWEDGVELYEDEDPNNITPFEKAVEELDQKHHVWNTLHAADLLARQSTYSVILIGAPGDLNTELPKSTKLLYLQPFFGGGGPSSQSNSAASRMVATDADVTIETFDTDTTSERFGDPTAYRIRRTDLTSPQMQKEVHWTRIIHICEGALDNRVYGVPALEAVWNYLMDLMKVTGGGSESFYQRAKHTLNPNIQKDASFTDTDMAALREVFEKYEHGLTNILPTRDVDVKLLESSVANFSTPADAILTLIAGTTGIPKRILTGSEMGKLASTQDAENFDKRLQNRRTRYAGPMMVRKLFDRLIEYGYLPTPSQYRVGWPTEEEDKNKQADFAVKLATVNKTQGDIVFTDAEIREKAFDMDPLDDTQRKEIADRAAEKMQMAQDAMAAAAPPADEKKPAPFQRAAMLRDLEAAIEAEDLDAIGKLLDLESPVQRAIAMLSDAKNTEDVILAKEFVASLGATLSTKTDDELQIAFNTYRETRGMGFDGKRNA